MAPMKTDYAEKDHKTNCWDILMPNQQDEYPSQDEQTVGNYSMEAIHNLTHGIPRMKTQASRQRRDADGSPDPIRDIRPVPVTMKSVKMYPSTKEDTVTGVYSNKKIRLLSVVIRTRSYAYPHTYLLTLVVFLNILVRPRFCVHVAWRAAIMCAILNLIPTIHAQTLIGYDTAGRYSEQKITMKTISLLGVESCSAVQTQSYSPPAEHQVQIVYKPSETVVPVIQCSIKLTVDVYPCAENLFRSDAYPSDVIDRQRIIPLSGEECRSMYTQGRADIDVYGTIIRLNRITHNTQKMSKTIIGTKKQNGGCKGGTIEIGNTKREGVIVIAALEFFYKEWRAIFSPTSHVIHVGDLVTFAPSDKPAGSCDSEFGCFYTKSQDSIPANDCERTVPFLQGRALVYKPATSSDLSMQGYPDIIQITSTEDESQGTTLTLGDSAVVCNTLVRKTNIPRLFVNFYEEEEHKLIIHRLSNTTLINQNQHQMVDILTSSSNLYLRGTLSISDQFDRVSFRLCELRRAALLGVLRDLLTSGPAPLLDYREGILFRRVGSVVYIFMGNPIVCRLRPTQECYNEIPVHLELESGDEPAFLTSKGRVIVSNGTVIRCGEKQAMHFIRNDEMDRVNKTLTLFQDLTLSEVEETETEGSWVCQYPEQFVHCNAPSSLSPSIGVNDHFLGIKGQFITQTIFGQAGREILYRTQTEGFNREVMWTSFTNGGENEISSNAGDVILANLSEAAQRRIRSIVLPTLVFLFGDLITYIGQFLIAAFIWNLIYRMFCLMSRLIMVYKNKGCSRHLLICVFEGIYNAIIPWRAAAEEKKNTIEEMSAKLDQQGEDLRNLWALHFLPKAPEPTTTLGRSPLTRIRQMGLGHYPFLDNAQEESTPLANLNNARDEK